MSSNNAKGKGLMAKTPPYIPPKKESQRGGALDSVQKVTAFVQIWDQFHSDAMQLDSEDK